MKYIIIGERYRGLLEEPLSAYNCKILWMSDNPDINPNLAGHADLSVFYNYPEQKLYLAPFIKDTQLHRALDEINANYEFLNLKQGAFYPNDVQFNIFQSKNLIIFNPDTASDRIVQNLSNRALKISVKQGYSRCCTLPAGEESTITSDNGIYSELIKNNINALHISQGYIDLPGFKYGFIGGAAINFDNEIAFTGSLDAHPDKNKILNHLENNNIKASFLTEHNIFDIGGAIVF